MIKRMTIALILLQSLLVCNIVFAQDIQIQPFSINQEPGDFYFIENDLVKIVFKKQYKDRAFLALETIEKQSENLTKGFKLPPKKITIFLRSNTTTSNGYVGLMPFKSEFFDAPFIEGQLDLGEWVSMLSLHEYRHVVQFSQSYSGFSRIMYWVLGEFGIALTTLWSTPSWVHEGDATYTETAITDFGRGRNAAFSSRFRALLLSGADLNYEDLYFNSPYEYFPDFYKFGFFFFNFLKEKYDFNIEKSFSEVARKSFNPLGYIRVIKGQTGKDIDELVEEFLEFYGLKWASSTNIKEDSKSLVNDSKYTKNYQYPFVNTKGEIVSYVGGVKQLSRFSKLDPNGAREETLHYPGSISTRAINSEKDTIFWIENRVNSRYATKSKNIICSLDTYKNKHNCFYLNGFERSYDRLGRYSITSSFHGKSSITLYKNEKKIFTKTSENNSLYINPQFKDKNSVVYIMKNSKGVFSLRSLTLDTQKEKTLMSSERAIRRHKIFEDRVFFEWEKSEVQEIYSFNTKTKKILKHTNSKFAAINPEVHNGELYFSRSSANGFKLHKKPINNTVDEQNEISRNIYITPSVENKVSIKGDKSYDVHKFDDDTFNFHSWTLIPPLVSPMFTLAVTSDNESETVSFQAGINHFSEEETGGVFADLSLKGFYVPIDLGASVNQRSKELADEDYSTWRESNFYIGPKFIYQNNFSRWFQAGYFALYLAQSEIGDKEFDKKGEFSNGVMQGGILKVGYSIGSNSNRVRPLSPLSFSVDYTLKDLEQRDGDQKGKLSNLYSSFTYGIFDTLSIALRYEKEIQHEKEYEFLSELIQARGYSLSFSPDIEVYKLDLVAPLMGLEGGIRGWIYTNSITAGLFYDKMQYADDDDNFNKLDFSSYGLEFKVNTYFFRSMYTPIGIGLRGFYKNSSIEDDSEYVGEVFLSSAVGF